MFGKHIKKQQEFMCELRFMLCKDIWWKLEFSPKRHQWTWEPCTSMKWEAWVQRVHSRNSQDEKWGGCYCYLFTCVKLYKQWWLWWSLQGVWRKWRPTSKSISSHLIYRALVINLSFWMYLLNLFLCLLLIFCINQDFSQKFLMIVKWNSKPSSSSTMEDQLAYTLHFILAM